ncbi:hypothetical protein TcWFU_009009 [Taenia crassiceps]|uniref:Uncharacterized protein n=1 Tax=Taenia crassiceps TaxID=6207 RepID=A0ABR4QT25_9CEST
MIAKVSPSFICNILNQSRLHSSYTFNCSGIQESTACSPDPEVGLLVFFILLMLDSLGLRLVGAIDSSFSQMDEVYARLREHIADLSSAPLLMRRESFRFAKPSSRIGIGDIRLLKYGG